MPIKCLILVLFSALLAHAEVHTLTLQQALDLASRQSPDVALARLDAQRAEQNISVVRNPFSPRLYAGSGAAYTYGYPNAIGGNAPSIFSIQSNMALYNRPAQYQVAAAKENVRGTLIDAQAQADEVAYRTANYFLDAQRAAKEREAVDGQLPSLRQAVETMQSRVSEGAELPVESKRAAINLAQAEQQLDTFKADEDYAEMLLAVTLGFPAKDRVHPARPQETFKLPAMESEDESIDVALKNSKSLRRLQSAVLAKQLEIRSYKAARLPQVDLVAQYSLFAKYAYTSYFQKFQYNNAQIGASFTLPIFVGSGISGQYEEAATDMAKLRLQINQTRNQISVNTRRSYQEMRRAQETRDLARQQLDLAHDDLSVLLAQYTEGRVRLSDVEKARAAENDRWLALYETENQYERAKLGVLHELGNLMATLRSAADGGGAAPDGKLSR
ncbi:MAG TPA: TolC family protein [Bryobacteraceae bacterium]|nr:TolC family protein [Bryobacteraceae bacterium]